jgi:hypothetical protein
MWPCCVEISFRGNPYPFPCRQLHKTETTHYPIAHNKYTYELVGLPHSRDVHRTQLACFRNLTRLLVDREDCGLFVFVAFHRLLGRATTQCQSGGGEDIRHLRGFGGTGIPHVSTLFEPLFSCSICNEDIVSSQNFFSCSREAPCAPKRKDIVAPARIDKIPSRT